MAKVNPTILFKEIRPTVFLRRRGGHLEQRLSVTFVNSGAPNQANLIVTASGGHGLLTLPVKLPRGETAVDVFIPEFKTTTKLFFALETRSAEKYRRSLVLAPPRRWKVHVVQLSHHDVGYTDLVARAKEQHVSWLDSVLELSAATRHYPEEARFRIIVEQAWSIDHYLRHAAPARARQMLKLVRAGDVEVTALFGNMVTELCSHEALARTLYPAFRLAHAFRIPIISAEHNDIPGFSWGLSQILAEAGIRIFCPGLPSYYSWDGKARPSFWDEERIFGYRGMPGVFWWVSPSGKRVLFWSNNQGCGGDFHGSMPALAERLQELADKGYPYDILRWPVIGGARDNSPYIGAYAETIRDWNERWAYPQLVSSTNSRFLADLSQRVDLQALRVWRGDIPGQDYSLGVTSTARATAVNRHNQAELPAAEALATTAALHAGHHYPQETLREAAEDILWHNEHTWGYHFPCGPASAVADLEKALPAHRAAALLQEVRSKALARLADAIHLKSEGIYLLVFNPLPFKRSDYVSTPLRELDNCGSEMVPVAPQDDPQHCGYLRGVILNTRWPVHPPPELVEGKFDLVDTLTGATFPYQIMEIDSALGGEDHAAQRLGLAAGGPRYGFFDLPIGLKRTLVFRAAAVPALGYRLYLLAARSTAPTFPAAVSATATCLENRFYRIELDRKTGAIRSLFTHRSPDSPRGRDGGGLDKQSAREWIDRRAPHALGPLIVREPSGRETLARCEGLRTVLNGPLCAALRAVYSAPGHPRLELTVMLRAEERSISIALGMLKDPTPLLETFLAFPFRLRAGRFLFEGPLSVIDPARGRLPGAFANRLTVQNWLRASNGKATLLWSSADAPVVSLARLWPSRVSPAHACILPPQMERPPQKAEELRGGVIYSCLTSNNFGTNFSVSQSGPLLFRYSLCPQEGPASVSECARFGARIAAPLATIFTERKNQPPGSLPAERAGQGKCPFGLELDQPAVQLLAFKRAEDGRGSIVRLWNVSDRPVKARLRLSGGEHSGVQICTLMETDSGTRRRRPNVRRLQSLRPGRNSVRLKLLPQQVLTLRLTTRGPEVCASLSAQADLPVARNFRARRVAGLAGPLIRKKP